MIVNHHHHHLSVVITTTTMTNDLPSRLLLVLLHVYHRDVQIVIVEFLLTEPIVGSREVEFSTSREEASLPSGGGGAAQLKGPAVQVEGPAVFFSSNKADAHTDPSSSCYINNFNAEVTLSKSKRDRYQQRADAVLRSVYPAMESRVELVHVCPSTLSPYLSCTAAKFGCKISATTEIAVSEMMD